MLRLRNRLLPMLRAANPLNSPIHPRACHLLSTSTSASTTFRGPFSLEDYLAAAAGLTPAQAREVPKKAFRELSCRKGKEAAFSLRLNSASNPDSILGLLSGAGLSRPDIAAVVSADPLLLRASPKNIGPRLDALRDRIGLSTSQIVRFLLIGSHALRECDVLPRLEFFISFFGSFEQVLRVAKNNRALLTASLERKIKPNIALFCQFGVRGIATMCSNCPWLITFNPERLKEVLLRAEELGVPSNSGMFKYAVIIVSRISEEKVAAKLEFFQRTLGCSKSVVSAAVSKIPGILGLSDEVLRRKIEFLVNEAAIKPECIMQTPVLLAMSLGKRLVPRHYVMKVLKEKRLLNSDICLFSFFKLGEEKFKLRFIDCHKNSIPGLADAYATGRAGIVPSTV